jgi:alpha-D-ribose 1-methylphosphonate 5-triphosphate synthase subunit PhnL
MIASPPVLTVTHVAKAFTMHLRDGARLPVLRDVSFQVQPGECLALTGPSGAGKSSLLRMIYGNYRSDSGSIIIRSRHGNIDMVKASPRHIHAVRRSTISYVTQFLRVIPRVTARAIVVAAGRDAGLDQTTSEDRASELLTRLRIPKQLWSLPPATFSGGEQQRVNLARGLIGAHSILLLDEPTASLDAANRETVLELVTAQKVRGTAIVGIFHDADARSRLADRSFELTKALMS